MIEIYVTLVREGKRAIEDVPLRYREEVKRALEGGENID